MYTYSMKTIYLSLSAQVAVGTFFMKSPVLQASLLELLLHIHFLIQIVLFPILSFLLLVRLLLYDEKNCKLALFWFGLLPGISWKRYPQLPVCTRDRYMVSIEWVYTSSTFYMKSAVVALMSNKLNITKQAIFLF